MEQTSFASRWAGVLFVTVAVLACAPPAEDTGESVGGAQPEAGVSEEQSGPTAVAAFAPVPVQVTITKTDDDCTITVSQDPVTLYKDPAHGSNKALWTWTGADYERAWVSVPPNDLRTCIDVVTLKDGGQRGFEIEKRDGTRKTIDPSSDCKPGEYTYEIGAKGKGMTPDCGADPRVIILD